MSKVILFVKDLKLGTDISQQIIENDHNVVFYNDDQELDQQINESVNMAILNLDDANFGTVHFVSTIKMLNRRIKVVGYMKHIQKQKHDKLKAAGCNMILPRASISKNISTFLDII